MVKIIIYSSKIRARWVFLVFLRHIDFVKLKAYDDGQYWLDSFELRMRYENFERLRNFKLNMLGICLGKF